MNTKKSVIFPALILSLTFLTSKAQNYSVSSVADSLKDNAHSIIRDYSRMLELQAVNSGIQKIKKVITVLDKNGAEDAILTIYYDKNSSITIDRAILYDKNGKKLKNIKESDIIDVPVHNGASLYSDDRMKYYEPNYADYPYTLEYEYEIKSENLLSYGSWFPVSGYNISVEHSKFALIHPAKIQFRKKELNTTIQPAHITQSNKEIETWEYKNLKAKEDEPFNLSLSEMVPRVILMPTQLVYDEYSGNADNWNEFGKWVFNLYYGRDELAEEEKIKITDLLINTKDTIQTIKTLYEYMQQRTRYVGIQLGIGGYQPFSAQSVFETGYGDCKALSNYMHSLLKQAGIKSYPVLVSSGRYIEPIFPDFPNFSQFDHVILCVPGAKDTIWLECTNQNIPFGFLGDFTDDRDVLLITEEGGKLAHTKKYTAKDNLRTCKAEFIVDSIGTASGQTLTHYQGLQYDDISFILNIKTDEQKKWLYQNSSLPSLQINKFDIREDKRMLPAATVNESAVSKNYGSFTGNYMLLPLNKNNVQSPIQKQVKERVSDFIIHRSSMDYDTLIYTIPESYKIESIPTGKSFTSPFGDYSFAVKSDGNKIIYTRLFTINQGRYKASEYKRFYDFCLSVSKADNEKAMLVKKK
ncbi:MAG TPA: DUF3857 domain-containing protein [Prolixibacteraceae bacterium]|nr:DUF3857 domain-containing protein [Prolixibacteraceae bacterium]HPS12413.1 DUF3857 domain-containing protein [Prolixibacteraceae bacterium]